VTGAAEVRAWELRHTGERPPTMNAHRRLHPQQRARVDARWRAIFHALAREAHIPPLDRCNVIVRPLHRNGRSPQDVAGCAPAAKAAVDGVVDAGVLPHDGPAHLLSLTFLPPLVDGHDGMVVRILEAA
jgi:crossover junction endodeoxyribonuclease RusA